MKVPVLESRGNAHTPTCTAGAQPRDFKGLVLLFANFLPQMFDPQLVADKTMRGISQIPYSS